MEPEQAARPVFADLARREFEQAARQALADPVELGSSQTARLAPADLERPEPDLARRRAARSFVDLRFVRAARRPFARPLWPHSVPQGAGLARRAPERLPSASAFRACLL